MREGNFTPKGRKLDFALAMISAIRAKHDIRGAMSLREIATLTQLIAGSRGGCSRQNIDRIEKIALRKVRQRLTQSGTVGILELRQFAERKVTA